MLVDDFDVIESRLQILPQSLGETSERDYLIDDLISEMLQDHSLLLQ
jgi:hypothetical protein